jgi:hypothetical protein
MVILWDKCGTESMILSAKFPVYNVGGVAELVEGGGLENR